MTPRKDGGLKINSSFRKFYFVKQYSQEKRYFFFVYTRLFLCPQHSRVILLCFFFIVCVCFVEFLLLHRSSITKQKAAKTDRDGGVGGTKGGNVNRIYLLRRHFKGS